MKPNILFSIIFTISRIYCTQLEDITYHYQIKFTDDQIKKETEKVEKLYKKKEEADKKIRNSNETRKKISIGIKEKRYDKLKIIQYNKEIIHLTHKNMETERIIKNSEKVINALKESKRKLNENLRLINDSKDKKKSIPEKSQGISNTPQNSIERKSHTKTQMFLSPDSFDALKHSSKVIMLIKPEKKIRFEIKNKTEGSYKAGKESTQQSKNNVQSEKNAPLQKKLTTKMVTKQPESQTTEIKSSSFFKSKTGLCAKQYENRYLNFGKIKTEARTTPRENPKTTLENSKAKSAIPPCNSSNTKLLSTPRRSFIPLSTSKLVLKTKEINKSIDTKSLNKAIGPTKVVKAEEGNIKKENIIEGEVYMSGERSILKETKKTDNVIQNKTEFFGESSGHDRSNEEQEEYNEQIEFEKLEESIKNEKFNEKVCNPFQTNEKSESAGSEESIRIKKSNELETVGILKEFNVLKESLKPKEPTYVKEFNELNTVNNQNKFEELITSIESERSECLIDKPLIKESFTSEKLLELENIDEMNDYYKFSDFNELKKSDEQENFIVFDETDNIKAIKLLNKNLENSNDSKEAIKLNEFDENPKLRTLIEQELSINSNEVEAFKESEEYENVEESSELNIHEKINYSIESEVLNKLIEQKIFREKEELIKPKVISKQETFVIRHEEELFKAKNLKNSIDTEYCNNIETSKHDQHLKSLELNNKDFENTKKNVLITTESDNSNVSKTLKDPEPSSLFIDFETNEKEKIQASEVVSEPKHVSQELNRNLKDQNDILVNVNKSEEYIEEKFSHELLKTLSKETCNNSVNQLNSTDKSLQPVSEDSKLPKKDFDSNGTIKIDKTSDGKTDYNDALIATVLIVSVVFMFVTIFYIIFK